jgi:hypothetical protein
VGPPSCSGPAEAGPHFGRMIGDDDRLAQ